MFKKDIKFMKKLIYIANEKFEELEFQVTQQNQNNTCSRKTLNIKSSSRVFGKQSNLNVNLNGFTENIMTMRERS